MSGARGAQLSGMFTATTYESVEGGKNKSKMEIRSKEDEGTVQDKLQDKVKDVIGKGRPVFGEGKGDEGKQDMGAIGTG